MVKSGKTAAFIFRLPPPVQPFYLLIHPHLKQSHQILEMRELIKSDVIGMYLCFIKYGLKLCTENDGRIYFSSKGNKKEPTGFNRNLRDYVYKSDIWIAVYDGILNNK